MIDKLIPKLKANALAGVMTVLTPEEAQAIHEHIDSLDVRLRDKEQKFMMICDHTYDLVKFNRDLQKQIKELTKNDAQGEPEYLRKIIQGMAG